MKLVKIYWRDIPSQVLVQKGRAKQIIIFIHGFNFKGIGTRKYYTRRIKAAKFQGRVYYGKWNSAGLTIPAWLSLALLLGGPIGRVSAILAAVVLKRFDFNDKTYWEVYK